MTFVSDIARHFVRAVLQTLLILSLAVTSFLLAWSSLRVVDFGYPWLYEALSIEQHIEQWAPQNRYREGFEATTRQERLAIFGTITAAIHNKGEGLEAIHYTDQQGNIQPFLRAPEGVHLHSVAGLVDLLYGVGWLAVVALVVSATALRRSGTPPPRLSRILLGTIASTALVALLVVAIGPVRLFYTAHQWLFPPGEQWYFTYQESLMTTLMKAPDLFGGIVALLVMATLLYFGLLFLACRFWLSGHAA